MADNIEQIHQPASELASGASQALVEDAYKDGEKVKAEDRSARATRVEESFGNVQIVDATKEKIDKPATENDKKFAPGDDDAAKRLQVDSKKVEQGTVAVHEALYGLWRSDSDYEKVNKILQGMSEQERKELKEAYKTKYGVDLENEFKDHAKDAQQDKALNLLNKKEGIADDAGRIHTAIIEHHQLIEGRSKANCEKDLRDTLSSMNSEQIQQCDQDYFKRYGKHLSEVFKNDDGLSQKTKDALEVYLKGSDKRSDDETLKLADAALKTKDLEMFQEAMRGASPEARKKFNDDGGEKKLKEAFEGHWYNALPYAVSPALGGVVGGNVTDKDLNRAQDYAKDGHLSTALKIRENTGIVSNSDKAIETALKDMSQEERDAYLRGKKLNTESADESKLSDADKKALKTYRELHKALDETAPLDSAKKDKWEDMIAHKGGSLVGRIESHHGVIYNDNAGDAKKEIENMTKSDWEYGKKHPEYREQVLKSLMDLKGASVNQEDIDKAMKLYDDKIKCKTFEESTKSGYRPLLDRIQDDTHWYKNDRNSMVEAVSHMSKDEQERYKNDPEYRKKLDDLLKDKIGEGPALEAAKHMLAQIKEGKAPESDLIVKMNMRAQENDESNSNVKKGVMVGGSILFPFMAPALAGGMLADEGLNNGKGPQASTDAAFGSHSAKAIRDMEDEFAKHPELREKLLHPKTDEEKKQAEEFKKAAVLAMGEKDYDKYAKPLLETGHLSIDQQMQLNKGVISNDKDGSYKDILNASKQEKEKILHDKAYQDKVLGYLSDDDRKVALSVLEQGKAQPEDKIRAKINHWGGSDEVMSTLREIKDNPQAIEKMKEEYARKYGRDLTVDLLEKLDGANKTEADAILRKQPTSAREAFNDARDQYYQSYDGAGKAFVNGVWDGTGHMTEDAMNQYVAKMADASAKFKELPIEQQKELTDKLHKALDNFVESKGAAADAVVDAVIAIAAVGGAVFTDGVSLGLLAATGAGGAALKVLVNSVLMGSDYDWSAKNVSKDAAVGFINGFVSMLGPGEVGQLLKVGEVAAQKATQQVLKEGAEQLLKKGGQELLEKELSSAVRNAVVHGSYQVSDKAIDKMVVQLAKEGATDAEKAMLKQTLKTALEQNLDKEGKSLLRRLATEYAFNMAGGAMGGSSSSAFGAALEWDNSKSISENMSKIGHAAATGAAFGAIGAAGFTTVFKVGGSMYHGLVEAYKLKPGEKLSGEQLAALAKETGVKDAKLRYDEHGNLVLEGKVEPKTAMNPQPELQNGQIKPDRIVNVGDGHPPVVVGKENPTLTTHPIENGGKVPEKTVIDTPIEDAPPTIRDFDGPPQTERLPQGVSPEVKQILDRADIPSHERAAILQRIRENELAKPENVKAFAAKGVEAADKWENFSALADEGRANKVALRNAESKMFHTVHDDLVNELVQRGLKETDAIRLANNPTRLAELARVDRRMGEFFDSVPTRRQALDEMVKAIEVNNRYEKAAMDRTADLQKMMDDFARENNLPKTRIKLVDGAELGGANGVYQDGIIRLNKDHILANTDTKAWMETLYHEYTHNGQDALIIRSMADKFETMMGNGYKLHQPPTAVELRSLQALYSQERMGPLSPEHLTNVLEARAGKTLTEAETKLAGQLMRDWTREGLGPYNRYWQNIHFVNEKLNGLDNIGASKDIIGELAKNPDGALAHSLFGQRTPAELREVIKRYTANGGNIDEAGAKILLRKAMERNRDQLMEYQQALYKQYISAIHETEAFILGQAAKVETVKELDGPETGHR